jgi:EAL domain-containing protein (putative c-di-GMP-specific phosphodiesterase class I)
VRNHLETKQLYRQLEHRNSDLKAELDAHAERERSVAAERESRRNIIQQALAPGSITMVFQPVVDIASGGVVGAEALARFNGEPRRPPNVWFDEAFEFGLGPELELSAIAAALDDINRLPLATFLAVNVSPTTAMTPELHTLLTGSVPERIVLELTEHHRIDDYESLVSCLNSLRRHGVRVAADDTGAGYAGFRHILRLCPDILKLDTTLTRGIDTDPIRRSLATALVNFAEEIHATIIAEGIEIPGELEALQTIGIHWGQGYHLAHPMPLPLPTGRLDTSDRSG